MKLSFKRKCIAGVGTAGLALTLLVDPSIGIGLICGVAVYAIATDSNGKKLAR